MADKSKIEWTDATWNPITGCTPVSAGCQNCYAKRMAERFPKAHGPAPWADVDREVEFKDIIFHPSRLDQPLRWKKPRRIFVCSMGDLFHEDVAFAWIDDVRRAMTYAPQHTYMVLTKRPERMKKYFNEIYGDAPNRLMIPNLWLGVTVENDEVAYPRISALLQTPAAKRFVSVEPMLGPVDMVTAVGMASLDMDRLGDSTLGPHWIICGGETGPGARPMHPNWPRSLRDQCQSAEVPFFFKGWGEWWPDEQHRRWYESLGYCASPGLQYKSPRRKKVDGESYYYIGKQQGRYLLDGQEWKEFPVTAR